MSIGIITVVAIGCGLLGSLMLLALGMSGRNFLKAWPVASALIFTVLLGAASVLRLVGGA